MLLVQRFQGAIVTTTKGSIRIKFQPEAAPFTVLNFIRLAQRSFYDGTVFHRVVPNFVIQGGDPLGTGFGGPGYAINTEIHPDAKFTTGAVGMASAGRNTEGSQFFITHCTTPHLNGGYTVFGKTDDRTVVDAVQEGDSILSVRLMSE
jgi:peptidyl-prolyl cis-trans isomerase B (cyclophilin B)